MKADKAKKKKEKVDVKKDKIKGMNPSDEIYVLARCKRNGESNKLEDCYGVPVSTYVDPCCRTTPTCCC